MRTVLVDASWRLVQYQPTYKPVPRWLPLLTHPKTTRAKRKYSVNDKNGVPAKTSAPQTIFRGT